MAERDIAHRLRRAVKENNLSLVKRLSHRTDMRNPDPSPCRYTSLAWAAVCGCEEVFEYLLLAGHDDDELSKDSEKNTILCLLASVKNTATNYLNQSLAEDIELQLSAIRMGRLYWERFPFITDWCNQQGKTATHIAALHGRDEFVRFLCEIGADIDLSDTLGNCPLHYASAYGHVSVIQTLIERGCNFNSRNNDGFTPSDYAYSNHTFDALQEAALTRFEANKQSRAAAQQQARLAERSGLAYSHLHFHPDAPSSNHLGGRTGRGIAGTGARRWRSGSGTTSASDSTDYEGALSTSAPGSSQFSGHSSSGSLPRPPPSNGTILTPIPSANRARNVSTSSSHAPSHSSRPSFSSANARSGAGSSLSTRSPSAKVALSPVASRIAERDAGAMADYRGRSGSHSSTATGEASNLPATTAQPTTHTTVDMDGLQMSDLRARTIPRSLRPSLSAASLRPNIPLPSISSVTSGGNGSSRIRAGTLDNLLSSSSSRGAVTGIGTPKTPPAAATFLQTLKRPVLAVLPGSSGGRTPEALNNIPDGHTRRPSGSLLRDMAALNTDSM